MAIRLTLSDGQSAPAFPSWSSLSPIPSFRVWQACDVHPTRCTWTEYEFAYKPGNPARAPPWVAPHMPRLDWQMWFLAFESSWSQVLEPTRVAAQANLNDTARRSFFGSL